jgi:hypothetical protein
MQSPPDLNNSCLNPNTPHYVGGQSYQDNCNHLKSLKKGYETHGLKFVAAATKSKPKESTQIKHKCRANIRMDDKNKTKQNYVHPEQLQ